MVSRDAQRSIPHGTAFVLSHSGRPGLGSDVLDFGDPTQHRGLPGRNDRRARLGLPVAWIATPPTRVRGGNGSAPRRPTAPSAASVVTAPGATTSRRSRLAFPTRRSSTPRPPRPRLSRRSSATTATSSTGTTGTATAKNPAGSARKVWAGPGAGATPRAAAYSAALPATTPTRGRRSTTTAQYEAKCLACHSATTVQPAGGPGPLAQATTEPGPRICPVDPAKGCIKCHMPGVRMDSSHREMTDHYIRIPRS